MTGFGSGRARLGGKGGSITVEVRSVNQRFLDVKLQLPRELASREAELRADIESKVSRGRVDVQVHRAAAKSGSVRIDVDEELARAYVEAWRRLGRRLRLPGEVDLGFLQGRGELFRVNEVEVPVEASMRAIRRALAAALRQLDRARRREGRNLARDMRGRVGALEGLARRMLVRARANAGTNRRRLETRMRELLGDRFYATRVVQEAAMQAERSDVSEEIVRLESHLAGMRKLFAGREPAGRRIEFLLQELQREVNTISSKSNDLRLTELALGAKGEVEKLREQVQNVE